MTRDQDDNSRTNTEGGEQPAKDKLQGSLRPAIKLDPVNVPPELHPLIPYAENWGIQDEELQRTLLRKASLAEVEQLCQVLFPLWDDVWKFVNSRASRGELQNLEVRVFDALLTAGNEAGSILEEMMPKRLLEVIGCPEKFPGVKIDPSKLPPEFHSLIPHVEKWVVEDESVRDVVIRAATDEELAELISAVNQVGEPTIRGLASIIDQEDATRWKDGYALLILLQLAEQAQSLLRSHHRSNAKDRDKPE